MSQTDAMSDDVPQPPAANQQFHMVVLCQGVRANGEPYWAYLQMQPLKAKAFRQAQASGELDLEDFGEIIEWGTGETVPADIYERMEREHRVSHDFEERLRAAVTASHQKKPAR